MVNVHKYLILIFALPAILIESCSSNLYEIAYVAKTTFPEKAEFNGDWRRESTELNFSLDGINIKVRPAISLSSRSGTIFFIESTRTPFTHESNFNYISVGLYSKNAGALISDISGVLNQTDSNYTVKPDVVYYANQQGRIISFMNSSEFILRNTNSIPIRQQDNFYGIKRWTNDSRIEAMSCFQFIYPKNMIIDSNTIYKMKIGKLKMPDGREQVLEIYLMPSFLRYEGH